MKPLKDLIVSDAKFSTCRKYRYDLLRIWQDDDENIISFIGLNPSTADEVVNDPTVFRCQKRAKSLAFSGMHMLNIFAYRDTDPKGMKKALDPIGQDNDNTLIEVCKRSVKIVCCWGNHGVYLERSSHVRKLLTPFADKIYCLGLNKNGEPKHPLYLSDATPLLVFEV